MAFKIALEPCVKPSSRACINDTVNHPSKIIGNKQRTVRKLLNVHRPAPCRIAL